MVQAVFSIIGMTATGLGVVLLVLHFTNGGSLSHSNEKDHVLHRLTEILLAIKAQNEILRQSDPSPRETVAVLMEIRNTVKDQLECSRLLLKSMEGPTLDAIKEIVTATSVAAVELEKMHCVAKKCQEHLFADVASRAQIDELIDITKSASAPKDWTPMNGILHADIQGVITKLDELELHLDKPVSKIIMPLDALMLSFDKFAREQKQFMNALFNGGSIGTVDDAEAAALEKIDALMRRYGISRELAEQRVRGSAVYEPNSGRGGMRSEV